MSQEKESNSMCEQWTFDLSLYIFRSTYRLSEKYKRIWSAEKQLQKCHFCEMKILGDLLEYVSYL